MHDFQEQCQVHGQQCQVHGQQCQVHGQRRMTSVFASSPQQEIEKLLDDKDSMILSLEMYLTFLHLIVL